MSRVQLALNVSDLDEAIAFYSSVFGTAPAKVEPGYANFAIADPPLKLVLTENPIADGAGLAATLNHLGVEVTDADEVRRQSERLAHEGLTTRVESGVTCCFATQDKVWVADPDGTPWEFYSVLADAPSRVDTSECCRVLHRRGRVVLLTPEKPPASRAYDAALWRRLTAEFLGSAFLAALVIGSGIAAQQLSPGNTGLQLLENAAATAAGLYAIILMFGPVSGGHFNPVVSLVDAVFRGITWRDAVTYVPAQVAGCIAGAVVANIMFSRAAFELSTTHRASPAHFLSEVVATLGLLLVIFSLARSGRSVSAPAAVGAYIGAAYFFTSSTSFANPAITVGRMFSDTFAGIAPSSTPSFISAQVAGGALAVVLVKVLYPAMTSRQASDILFPHHGDPAAASATDAAGSSGRTP